LKRMLLFFVLAAVSASFLPLAANSQVLPIHRPTRSADQGEATSYKWDVYAGYGYTSLNQVNQSRYGLEGVNASVTRYFGRFFGVTADGADYTKGFESGNPGKPTVTAVLGGPVLRAPIYGKTSGFFHVLLGGEHTGGENMTPNISFAGGIGGGLDYNWTSRFSIRASGDDIASSFSLNNNTTELSYSPHEHWNARATIGVVYKF